MLRKVKKKSQSKRNLWSDLFSAFLSPLAGMFSDEKCLSDYMNIPLSFPSRTCLKPIDSFLKTSCHSLAKMGMNFPGGCDDQVQQDFGISARSPRPTTHSISTGARGWAGSPQALNRGSGQALRKQKPFRFHDPHSYGKYFLGKSLGFVLFPRGHKGNCSQCRHSSQHLMATEL